MDRLRSEARSKIAIGVAGPHDLVEQLIHIGAELPDAAAFRLVGAPHAGEDEAHEKLAKIVDGVDAVLFTGPLQHDLARRSGELTVPATFVPVGGAVLYSGLLRGVLAGKADPARVSVDSVCRADVAEAYAEIGVPIEGVHVSEHQRPESARELIDFHVDFHEKLHRDGATSAALTTIRAVAGRLEAVGVPVVRMTPPAHTLRLALNTAVLLGTGNRMAESQIAIVLVELAAAVRPGDSGPGNYWQQELKLSLHRALLAEVRLLGATVVPRDENGYVVTATVGALARMTDGFRVAPFMDRVRAELGVAVEVGIGLGHTARDADANALAAVERARGTGATAAFLIGGDGAALSLPVRPRRGEPVSEPAAGAKALKVLDRLVTRLGDGPEAMVVDAETVARVLGVAPRSARRVLQNLAEEGLAWALPPVRNSHAGRPRQPYRLMAERTTKPQ
ncbi:GTP cyclohydrolase IIa [Spongiactinospora sp. TRM90649]|uniref:GTP cyclohydrolase IIa n=1 Tax=Spongiactinospora sp. TRM90649 TaxID=3031114 RepID=UPI0023F9200F|nr:GTP cyclohydrolase IIa [Spongiactinospora sp. TRM90649]MDF5751071.1 GTP cyclohydrolase IIa [Spongiactinospora sp. TRM90649]